VIGSGGYADNRWGAAASTGTGEVVLRTSATRSIILYMKMGMTVSQATREAPKDLRDLRDPYTNHIAIIALNHSGEHVGYSHRPNERYVYMTDTMQEAAEVDMAQAP
jgi:isoaspartyl peptidase/L-asparaginase-like protein (Ntn-hydrolase superfamily)